MTNQAEATRIALIKHLADGAFHSGEILSEQLGISRTAISKHCRSLGELGLDVFSVKGKGYRLAQPLQLLEHDQIKQLLPSMYAYPLEILTIIGSTNDYLKTTETPKTSGMAVLAEAQTAGRGRHGRQWVSPFGASLYLSMYWHFEQGYQAISGLSLAVGVALVEALQQSSVTGVQLKWPNDVYLHGKKLAGVLVEVEGQMGAACECIIGVGLNIALPQEQPDIDQPWTDLKSNVEHAIDRNRLAANVLNYLTHTLVEFEQEGLTVLQDRWQQHDIYLGEQVQLLMGKEVVTGIARGIDHSGGLLLERNGQVTPYYGGEISVRPV